MVDYLKSLLVLLSLSCISISCTPYPNGNEGDALSALTTEQQAAFDALNTLQTSTDERNRLYSSFPNADLPCYPSDTSFEVSQSELLAYMESFISKHCQNLSPESQRQLAQAAVLAQKKYTLLHCPANGSTVDYTKGLPTTGIWILPKVLDRRNVTLEW
ncbi:MAG: hypothetical protein AAF242_06930 [Bacteroidota bacterium]